MIDITNKYRHWSCTTLDCLHTLYKWFPCLTSVTMQVYTQVRIAMYSLRCIILSLRLSIADKEHLLEWLSGLLRCALCCVKDVNTPCNLLIEIEASWCKCNLLYTVWHQQNLGNGVEAIAICSSHSTMTCYGLLVMTHTNHHYILLALPTINSLFY